MDFKLLLVIFATQWILNSSQLCETFANSSDTIAVCSARLVTDAVQNVTTSTTHLLVDVELFWKGDFKFLYWGSPFNLSFQHLPALEVVLLNHPFEYSSWYIDLGSTSFPENSGIRRFMSRLPMSMASDALQSLHSLEDLTLSATRMKWEEIAHIVNESLCDKQNLTRLSLHRFSMEYGTNPHQINFDPVKVFAYCRLPRLRILDLSGNNILSIKGNFRKIFPGLRLLDVSHNQLAMKPMSHSDYLNALGIHTVQVLSPFVLFVLDVVLFLQLHTFNIGSQHTSPPPEKPMTWISLYEITDVPEPSLNCSASDNYYWLLKLFLNSSDGQELQNLCTTLEKAITSELNQRMNLPNKIVITSERQTVPKNRLSYVDFSNNYFVWPNQSIPPGVDYLQFVNLQSVNLESLSNLIHNFPLLRVLLLGRNKLGEMFCPSSLEAQNAFGSNSDLEILDLGQNSIHWLPHSLLENNSQLLELNLTENLLSHFTIDLSSQLQLKLINLSSNSLRNISEPMRNMLDAANARHPLTIDLRGNPLYCGCNDLDFATWMKETGLNIYGLKDMTCGHPYAGLVPIALLNVDDLQKECFPSNVRLILATVFITIALMSVLILSVLLYRKRWKLRYWWYLTKKGWHQMTVSADMTRYDYDAFVAHEYSDFTWVKDRLLVEMEEERGFKFCISHRDFRAGEILEEVIVDSIAKSRKTILVLTPHFVSSQWCNFELSIARNQLFDEGRDVILPVILEPLPAASINKTLHNILRKKLYLEWDEDGDAQKLFWQKLTDALDIPKH